jgi:glycosyltransferase involved in cell wall biosynthesis
MEFSCFLDPESASRLYERGRVLEKARALASGCARRWRDVRRTADFDLVVVHRWAVFLGPAWFETLAARRRPLVYDFDDAIFLPATSGANAWVSWLKPPGKTAAICRLARHVLAGNEYLATFARRHSHNVSVVPTTIDTDTYAVPAERAANGRPVVGWTGSVTTLPYLAALKEPLIRLAEDMDYELRVLGGALEVPGVRISARPWSDTAELEELRRFDVGLMPMPDDGWARGKCGLKALQYMALEVPPVVSPYGVNAEIVTDGVNGFHARTDAEWVDRVRRLVLDPQLRRRMGRAARRTVEERYSARVQAPVLARILRECAA